LGDEEVHHTIVHYLRLQRLGVGSTDVTSCRICMYSVLQILYMQNKPLCIRLKDLRRLQI